MRASFRNGPKSGDKLNERIGMCGCVWRGKAFKTDKHKKKDPTFMFMYWLIEHCFVSMLELQ